MKKQFLITESHKKYGVVNLWSVLADDLHELASIITENEDDFSELLIGLGGEEWDYQHRRYDQPSPEEVLLAIDKSFGESCYYQVFELPQNKTGYLQAVELDATPTKSTVHEINS
jgi:hypothetical protein